MIYSLCIGLHPKLDGAKLENYGVKNHHIPKIFKRQSYVVFHLVSHQFFLIPFDFSYRLIKKSSFLLIIVSFLLIHFEHFIFSLDLMNSLYTK